MLYLVIILVVFIVFLLYMFTGKPQNVTLKEDGFIDSYQYIDFEKTGRTTLPYIEWEDDLRVKVNGIVNFKKTGFIINRYSQLPLKIEIYPDISNPKNIELSFKERGIELYTENNPMLLKIDRKNNSFEILIHVKSKIPNFNISEPTKIGFSLEANYYVGKSTHGKKRLTYSFFVGKKLGETWIALDPGTTGSCIVTATEVDNITIQEDEDGEVITPSVISFNQNESPSTMDFQNDDYYQFGNEAVANMGRNSIISFQSFKKLLGFKDITKIKFANKTEIDVDGEILSELLIKGLLLDLKKYIENNSDKYKFLLDENKAFLPTRAIVAIPNNFTAPKIMDIVEALKSLKQFNEIRYISESEAVLCYYIHHHSMFNQNKENQGLKDETVLIFDMGGATINATIADAYLNQNNNGYNIDIDSKIGYSVGGDTVDYCLAKYFLDFSSDYPDLEKINPFLKNITKEDIINRKLKLIPILFDLKKKIVANYENEAQVTISLSTKRKVLLYPAEIQTAFKSIGVDMILSNASNIFTNFMEDEYGNFPVLKNTYFKEFVYDAIQDAVNDVVELSRVKGGHIDTIIFSGRTTMFPMIKETVTNQVKKIKSVKSDRKGQPINPIWVTLDKKELKTAVAKGACIYGIHRNLIHLSNKKTSSTIGFIKSKSLLKNDFEFRELIGVGKEFIEQDSNDFFVRNECEEQSDFKTDNAKINFFQVMGVNPNKIIQKKQKHKYSELAQIRIANPTRKISATVKNDDSVLFEVELNTGKTQKEFAILKSQEVSEANEEHYTWMVKS